MNFLFDIQYWHRVSCGMMLLPVPPAWNCFKEKGKHRVREIVSLKKRLLMRLLCILLIILKSALSKSSKVMFKKLKCFELDSTKFWLQKSKYYCYLFSLHCVNQSLKIVWFTPNHSPTFQLPPPKKKRIDSKADKRTLNFSFI